MGIMILLLLLEALLNQNHLQESPWVPKAGLLLNTFVFSFKQCNLNQREWKDIEGIAFFSKSRD